MDLDTHVGVAETQPVKKPPRKPRPSEIAAKKAKAGAKKAKAKKTVKRKASAKPKGKKKPAKKASKVKRPKTKARRKPAGKTKNGTAVRTERLDMRITKADKARIHAKAKRLRRTVTSVVLEAIERIR
jgi:hypothetical protein